MSGHMIGFGKDIKIFNNPLNSEFSNELFQF